MTALTLWLRRLWPFLALAAVVWASLTALDVWQERRGTPEQQRARQATVYAEHYVYRTDTLFQRDTVRYRAASTSYRTLRDTLRLTDTLQVRVAIERADTALARADTALAAAAVTIGARDSLAARLRDELAIARRPAPRLAGRALVLYEPLTATPAASLEATVRLYGRLSAVARADQRVALGERLRVGVGIAVAF
jgi:hypothetical protein